MRRFLLIVIAVCCLIACTRALSYWMDGKPNDDPFTPLVEGYSRFSALSLATFLAEGAPDISGAFQEILGNGTEWRPLGDFIPAEDDTEAGLLRRILDTIVGFFNWMGFALEYAVNTLVGAFRFAYVVLRYLVETLWYILTGRQAFA